MEWVPSVMFVIPEKVTPSVFRFAVATRVVPSRSETVPVGTPWPEAPVTIALKARLSPKDTVLVLANTVATEFSGVMVTETLGDTLDP